MVQASQPATRPYDVCLGEPGTREVALDVFYMGHGVLVLGYARCAARCARCKAFRDMWINEVHGVSVWTTSEAPYCCRNELGVSQKRKKGENLAVPTTVISHDIKADSLNTPLGVFVYCGFVSVATLTIHVVDISTGIILPEYSGVETDSMAGTAFCWTMAC